MAATRDSSVVIHRALREAILSNEIAAGAELSHARVARDFDVSRGPVREAFRLLEREGLLHSEVNQRARLAPFSIPTPDRGSGDRPSRAGSDRRAPGRGVDLLFALGSEHT